MSVPPATGGLLSTRSPPVQYAVLIGLSIVVAALLERASLPAALLIGPMLAAIVAGVNGATVRIWRPAFRFAQAIIGCLIAASISLDVFARLGSGWLPILGVAVATIAASSLLGWLISRWRLLPGTTAVWGSAPGAATAMVLMAGAFDADERLVAFMQYLRVACVSVGAALIARLWVDTSGAAVPPPVWFPQLDPIGFPIMLGVVAVGACLGHLARLPSPYFLGAFILGVVLHLGVGLPLQLPEWLLAMSYAVIGWSIGLNFTLTILKHAARALPQILGAIFALMAFCGGLGWLLSHHFGVDPLTAYLATSPGGLDSVAIIAAASDSVDISFVMASQFARFLIVLIFGPFLARLVTRFVRS